MTHPNVEYWQTRVDVCKINNLGAKAVLRAQMTKTGDDDKLFPNLAHAHARLEATESLLTSLLTVIQDYEERIRLLK